MKNTPFKQGPMSRNEAEDISRLYKKKGHEVVIADSMDLDGTYYVYVTFQNFREKLSPRKLFNKECGNKYG